jgi:hypothetical protein
LTISTEMSIPVPSKKIPISTWSSPNQNSRQKLKKCTPKETHQREHSRQRVRPAKTSSSMLTLKPMTTHFRYQDRDTKQQNWIYNSPLRN